MSFHLVDQLLLLFVKIKRILVTSLSQMGHSLSGGNLISEWFESLWIIGNWMDWDHRSCTSAKLILIISKFYAFENSSNPWNWSRAWSSIEGTSKRNLSSRQLIQTSTRSTITFPEPQVYVNFSTTLSYCIIWRRLWISVFIKFLDIFFNKLI